MKKSFFVSHHIALTPEEIETLQTPGNKIATEGTCVPVFLNEDGKTTEPATEIFVTYNINHTSGLMVECTEQGFSVNIANHLDRLLPYKRKGSNLLALSATDMLITEKYGKIPIYHQLVINPVSKLIQSLECCHLPQSSRKNGND